MRVLLHRPCISQELSINDKLGPFDPIREGTNDRLTCLRAELCTTVSVKIIQHISGFYADGLNSAWWYDLNRKLHDLNMHPTFLIIHFNPM